MNNFFRTVTRNLSNLVLALALSIAVWISAVSDSDPTLERVYPRSVTIDVVGKDPSLVLLERSATQVSLTLRAPQSIWDQLTREQGAVRALVDLSELGPGEHEVEIQVQIAITPVRVVSYSPASIDIRLDAIDSLVFPVRLIVRGEPAIGYQAGDPLLTENSVTLSGPSTQLQQVEEVRAILDIEGVSESIDRLVTLQAVDLNGIEVEGVSLNPSQVRVTQGISQLGGYRNVVVKVITTGQVASGYRVTNISVFPPAVTLFSDDPGLVEQVPGYVETFPLDLSGLKDDLDLFLSLNLPPGVSVVGDQEVEVQVGIAAIEGSVTLENMSVVVTGLETGYRAEISPQTVDVILSGPLPALDSLRVSDVRIILNVDGLTEGVYQRIPQIEIGEDIRVESILPGSIEVRILPLPTATPTVTENLGEELSTTGTPQPTQTPTSTP